MAFAAVLAVSAAVLCVTNYGDAFEFSGLDPSAAQGKTQLKPVFAKPANQDPYKSAVGANAAVAVKSPFGPAASFQPSFKSTYQPYPVRANYQPFGPYPGYPGPVVYAGHGGGYPGPHNALFPQPSYRFDDPKPFGYPAYPAPVQPAFKFGPAKKFNKNPPGPVEFNGGAKYFQEHQFGAYHGPEYSSAVVPAEHNVKLSKPKDVAPPVLFGQQQAVPNFPPQFGYSQKGAGGFVGPFGYPVPPNFPPIPSFFSTEQPSVKSVSSTAAAEQKIAADVTTAAVPSLSQDESATPQQASSSVAKNEEEEKVTDEPSVAATPAADPQPAQQEEVAATTAAAAAADADVATNDEAPAAEQQQQQSSGETTEVGELGGTVAADAETPVDATKEPAADPVVVVEPVQGTSDGAADNDGPASETPAVDGGSDSTPVADRKSEQVTVPGNKNDASAPAPGQPNEFAGINGGAALALSDPSPVGLFPGVPYFGQPAASFQQLPYYNSEPKFTAEELKAALAGSSFAASFPQSADLINGGGYATGKISEGGAVFKSSVPVEVTPSTESSVPAKAGENKEPVESAAVRSDVAAAPKKTVQILPDVDPFNGQLPVLYDPSNAGSPLDAYRFYNHPSVSALSGQASLASYSPEDAFANFGLQFRQGYLIEGSPLLSPAFKTVVQTSDDQTPPISISSKDHPLHGEIFKYSQSFVPYPQTVGQTESSSRSLNTLQSPAAAAAEVSSESDAKKTAAEVSSESDVKKTAAEVSSESDAKKTAAEVSSESDAKKTAA